MQANIVANKIASHKAHVTQGNFLSKTAFAVKKAFKVLLRVLHLRNEINFHH